ncbi:uncharacterized protein N7484_000991 [Penicillium longicatenatum]|uniref:uncharacterized protein n=1 Tax=Penicillium longicatenatum TaxID=1561947 RepID=UPI00254980C5|nr:uncharacterized protein N7484_000991 [Penicillium longicatenatum]KAJ5657342.1 hypothetical protein N7484_000991 [Penicillium longicatenatum]
MRRLDDGSKHATSANFKEHMPRTKLASKNKLKRLDFVQPLGISDMFLKDSYDVTTIARDVLIAAGKHPSEEVLNYHLHPLMKIIPAMDYSSDLTSLRWDRIDPIIYARDKRPRNPPTRPPAQPINAIGAVALSSFHDSSLPPQPSLLPSNPHLAKSDPSIPFPLPSSSTPIPTPERAPSILQAATETPTTKPSSTPRSKIPAASPPPRTKEALQPQVVIDSSPQKMPPTRKRVGRPRKDAKRDNAAVTVSSPSQPPTQYPVFKCRWESCQTELHTLVLLQKHVLKAHIPHNITCGWMECDNSTPMAASAMWEHMRDTHIEDYAWTLGDGPAVPSPGEDDQIGSPAIPQFNLFDRQARVSTVLLPLDPQVVKTYSKSHRINTPEQRAELFKNAGYRWKEEVGPDVDISDRRLSTPSRLVTSHLTEIAMTLPESP